MPVNPVVVVHIENGRVINSASNIGNDLNLVVVDNATAFNNESLGKPFDSRRPVAVEKPHTSKK